MDRRRRRWHSITISRRIIKSEILHCFVCVHSLPSEDIQTFCSVLWRERFLTFCKILNLNKLEQSFSTLFYFTAHSLGCFSICRQSKLSNRQEIVLWNVIPNLAFSHGIVVYCRTSVGNLWSRLQKIWFYLNDVFISLYTNVKLALRIKVQCSRFCLNDILCDIL